MPTRSSCCATAAWRSAARHAALLARDGLYARMWALQAEQEEPAIAAVRNLAEDLAHAHRGVAGPLFPSRLEPDDTGETYGECGR